MKVWEALDRLDAIEASIKRNDVVEILPEDALLLAECLDDKEAVAECLKKK